MSQPRAIVWAIGCAAAVMLYGCTPARAHSTAGAERSVHTDHNGSMTGLRHGEAAGAAVSFAALEETVEQLRRARAATAKYRDVRAAEADGYRAMGPYVAGQGFHYVKRQRGLAAAVDIERPPILLYEKAPSAPDGLQLVGISWLLDAPAGPDGQPATNPFPPALAVWHKHENICLLPPDGATVDLGLTGPQCRERDGRFLAQTPWMMHAWIWKDSPAGVFSPLNPDVQ